MYELSPTTQNLRLLHHWDLASAAPLPLSRLAVCGLPSVSCVSLDVAGCRGPSPLCPAAGEAMWKAPGCRWAWGLHRRSGQAHTLDPCCGPGPAWCGSRGPQPVALRVLFCGSGGAHCPGLGQPWAHTAGALVQLLGVCVQSLLHLCKGAALPTAGEQRPAGSTPGLTSQGPEQGAGRVRPGPGLGLPGALILHSSPVPSA